MCPGRACLLIDAGRDLDRINLCPVEGESANGYPSSVDKVYITHAWHQWQVPEEAWVGQSMDAAAEHIVSALRGKDFASRRTALLLVADNLGSRTALAPALSLAAARWWPRRDGQSHPGTSRCLSSGFVRGACHVCCTLDE